MNRTSFFALCRIPARLGSLLLGLALLSLTLSLTLALAHSGRAHAADAPDEVDPPDRAARLSFIQGEVSLQPAGEEEWASAIVNRPLTTGDKLWTDEGARAEIYVGQAAVRLGSDTGFSFLNVDDDTIQMRMTAGVMNVRVRALDENDQIEIDTPNLALSLLRPGNYRVEVNDEGDTTVVKVIEGEAEASGASQDVVVHAQEAATFKGNEQLASQFGSLGAPDAFDSWSLERDRRDQQAAAAPSAQYVSPEVTGYEDLDANGSWSSEPEYGYVWTPRVVAVDWSPYRYGRWVWVGPWGWTWVDDAPWGYAPFHYGRWAHVRNRWCWVPGPRHVRPVYAPALVGWVGSPGVSVSVSVGGGGVAWFPLGPREVYVPARRFSPRYVERVNVTNTVIVNKTYITNVYNNRITNVTYRNRGVPGGVTAVSRTTFTSAERVGRNTVRIDEREITRERATAVAPQIQPDRRSRLGMSDEARRNVRTPPATLQNRQVIVKRAPPPAAAHFARNAGQAAGRDQADRLHRLQDRADRNESAGRNRPSAGNDVRNDADQRNGSNARNDRRDDVRDRAGTAADARNGANAGNDANRDAKAANDARVAADARNDANRERAARELGERNAQDERPGQGRLRTDRPPGADRPAIPDHINRAPGNEGQSSSDRLQNEERQARGRAQADRDAMRAERNARQQQQQIQDDQQRRNQQQQDQQREQQAQQLQHEQQRRADQDQQRREQAQQLQHDQQRRLEQQQRDQQRREQQVQRLHQDQQQQAQRLQQDQQQREQQARERQAQQQQRDQQRQEQRRQREIEQQQNQQAAAREQARVASQSQDRGQMERSNRPEPARPAEQSRPQPQERERRRPDNNNREP